MSNRLMPCPECAGRVRVCGTCKGSGQVYSKTLKPFNVLGFVAAVEHGRAEHSQAHHNPFSDKYLRTVGVTVH